MFSREALNDKSLEDLRKISEQLGIQPIGSENYTSSFIVPLVTFGKQAIDECDLGLGLKRFPDRTIIRHLEFALEYLDAPTESQRALIKAASQGLLLERIDHRTVQQRLVEVYRARIGILEALAVIK